MFTFSGILNGIDKFNRIKIIVDDPTIITKKINDIKNPYHLINDNSLECFITINKHKEYFLLLAETHKYKLVTITVEPKRYCFDGKKGTSLILKFFEIIDI